MFHTKLTVFDKVFIAGNYEKLHVRQMAKALSVPAEHIRIYMRDEGYQTLYNRNRPVKTKLLSYKDKDFIKANWSTMTRAQLARAVGNTFHAVDRYLRNQKMNAFTTERVVIAPEPPKPKFERPPAVYSNFSYHH